ncbi:MAG: PA0069 family radical SAM protein [Proteobacteria bacterium]|nr:PA0069 family radical SAM protein [Pseudomonadota bacterium]
MPVKQAIKGRGAAENPPNRFERLVYETDGEEYLDGGFGDPDEDRTARPRTVYYRDPARTVLAGNQSPDVPFATSLNPYRGCLHGCVYCYARPTHEYLGFSAGLDFETKILVKENAPELLRRELSAVKWKPQVVALSGVTDPYQPIERKLEITRRCVEVFAEFRNPVGVVTKNALVARDTDLFVELAAHEAVAVHVSITTLDPQLMRRMEPRTSHPSQRLEAIRRLAAAGVPVGVMAAPIIPGLNDHEIPAILEAAAEAGASFAAHILLRLPYGVKDLFAAWLERHYPDRAKKVLNRIQEVRGGQGRLNDARFGSRMRGEGLYAAHVHKLFEVACRRAGLDGPHPVLSTDSFQKPRGPQLALFE